VHYSISVIERNKDEEEERGREEVSEEGFYGNFAASSLANVTS
jgi:hypothetical protein